jgi:hypothetical protein
VFSASDISLKSIPEELERSSSLDEELSVEPEDKSFELEVDVVAADSLDEDVVALEEDSFACELEEDVDALEEVVALEESPVLEEELLLEAFSLEEDDSISVSELSGSNCSAPVAELSLSPQAASNMAKKMQ